jgi:hypothetical protein
VPVEEATKEVLVAAVLCNASSLSVTGARYASIGLRVLAS